MSSVMHAKYPSLTETGAQVEESYKRALPCSPPKQRLDPTFSLPPVGRNTEGIELTDEDREKFKNVIDKIEEEKAADQSPPSSMLSIERLAAGTAPQMPSHISLSETPDNM
eukprot:gene25270-1668_t